LVIAAAISEAESVSSDMWISFRMALRNVI